MNKIDERENTLFDILLWDRCKGIACNKDITLSVSDRGYDIDKGCMFTDLQELYAFLKEYGDHRHRITLFEECKTLAKEKNIDLSVNPLCFVADNGHECHGFHSIYKLYAFLKGYGDE